MGMLRMLIESLFKVLSTGLTHLMQTYTSLFRLKKWGFYLLLGLSVGLVVLSNPVRAADTVLLQSRDLRLQVPLADLRAFVLEEEMSPALQQFLQDAGQDPAQVKRWLVAEINSTRLTSQISQDFVLVQLNKVVGDVLGREVLDPLRSALRKSLDPDSAFSILEILENYPPVNVRLELSRLGQVYNDVDLLVTRIQPVLQITEKLLPELLCECNDTGESSESVLPNDGVTAGLKERPDGEPKAAYQRLETALTSVMPIEAGALITDPGATHLAQQPSDSPGLVNKRLVFQFGPFGRSIALADLTRFAETGKLSSGWRFFFNVAGVAPEDVQSALNQQVSVDLKVLDRTLNNLLGEYLLYQVGQIIHTSSDTANIQALRSASILSVADNNQLSLLELLQQYPTPDVYINGVQLARFGRVASRFQARGGVRTAVVSLEDWLVELQATKAETVCTCDDQQLTRSELRSPPVAPAISSEQIAPFLPSGWQPISPHRDDHGIIRVVWLQGTPYDLGYQHGQFLHDEIASLGTDVLGALRFAGRGLALGRLAARRSYPDVVEECRGLTDATQDIGMTMDACLVLAYGDVFQEVFGNTLPNVLFWDGCSQWVATGNATVDGRLYHGSTLDNSNEPVDYILNNPVVFIRQPTDGLPHIFITYPGVVWPNWGLNVAGISVGLDSLHPRSTDELPLHGSSEVQIMGQVLRTATSFAEARQVMESEVSGRANLVMVTDGKSKEAGVFEIIGNSQGVRELQDNDVLYVTNHSVLEDLFERQRMPVSESSLTRFQRFAQLMEPDGIHSLYGQIDPAAMAKIGRDRTHPITLEPSPFEVFDDDASPGGNGSLRQGIYDPERLLFWVAGGPTPVPENPFVCFSLGELLNFPDATPCETPAL